MSRSVLFYWNKSTFGAFVCEYICSYLVKTIESAILNHDTHWSDRFFTLKPSTNHTEWPTFSADLSIWALLSSKTLTIGSWFKATAWRRGGAPTSWQSAKPGGHPQFMHKDETMRQLQTLEPPGLRYPPWNQVGNRLISHNLCTLYHPPSSVLIVLLMGTKHAKNMILELAVAAWPCFPTVPKEPRPRDPQILYTLWANQKL